MTERGDIIRELDKKYNQELEQRVEGATDWVIEEAIKIVQKMLPIHETIEQIRALKKLK